MPIVFVRHGATDATDAGLAQGVEDEPRNELNSNGILGCTQTATEIAEYLKNKNVDAKNVCIAYCDNKRCKHTADIIFDELKNNNLILNNDMCVFSVAGRNYGTLEGVVKEKDLKDFKKVFQNKDLLLAVASYIFAQLDSPNPCKIEGKNHYYQRVKNDFLKPLLSSYDTSKTFIIVVNSDLFSAIQKSEELKQYFNFKSNDSSPIKLNLAGWYPDIEMQTTIQTAKKQKSPFKKFA